MPEITVQDGSIAIHAKMAMEVHARLSELKAQEEAARGLVRDEAVSMVEKEREQGQFISVVRIVPEDASPARVEMRVTNASLDAGQIDKLNELYGPAVNELFETDDELRTGDLKSEEINVIIANLLDKGIDPWEVLGITIKDGAAAREAGVPVVKALVPKKGLLDKFTNLYPVMTDRAKAFTKKYVSKIIKPCVVLE